MFSFLPSLQCHRKQCAPFAIPLNHQFQPSTQGLKDVTTGQQNLVAAAATDNL
jgi:hypothetical protein